MESLKSWRCDKCGDQVGVADGYVIWGRFEDPDMQFRIIHKGRCDDRDFQSSLPLSDFVGPDGLIKLTSMLSYGRLDTEAGSSKPKSNFALPNLDVWVDFVRRVQVPHYEQARLLYSLPVVREQLAGGTEVAPYLQSSIAELLAADYG